MKSLRMAMAAVLLFLSAAVPPSAAPAPAGEDADTSPPAPVKDPMLARILEQWDKRQQETTTLVATFTERKELNLLAKPVVSKGEFFYSRPNRVRWEYNEPEHKVFVITEDLYTAYYPALKRAEEVPIKKFVGKRLFRFLGVGQKIGDLARYYDFSLAAQSDVRGTHLLHLTPRKRTVRDRVSEMKIWVDDTTFLPRQLQYVESDGDTTLLTFEGMQSNVDVAESRFKVDLPGDVAVSQTFNGFALGQQSF
ncbi:MAG TPA: outer membrane lipoprotein carrier protein LolA [Candidatus Polarisedimenticolia bacterium]|nr:outer membrane lipoprotein carrier protein LolA [Candidatus Polarisedimenticolia bacterium]